MRATEASSQLGVLRLAVHDYHAGGVTCLGHCCQPLLVDNVSEGGPQESGQILEHIPCLK